MPENILKTLGIIILNWNAADVTKECAGRLQEWERLNPRIYVLDNGSTEGSLDFSNETGIPVFLVRSPTNLGYAGGNNLGIRRALDDGCEFILLLNSDASISEEQLEILLDHLYRNPEIGCIGPVIHEGVILYIGGRDIGIHIHTRNTVSEKNSLKGLLYSEYVPGMVFLTKREVIKRTGFLDEQYFFSGEIADFCKRVLNSGWICAICGDAKAEHLQDRDNPHRSSLYQYYSLRNRFLFNRKHHPRLRWFLEPFWILWGIQRGARAAIMGKRADSRAYRMAIADGVRGIFGDRNELFSF